MNQETESLTTLQKRMNPCLALLVPHLSNFGIDLEALEWDK